MTRNHLRLCAAVLIVGLLVGSTWLLKNKLQGQKEQAQVCALLAQAKPHLDSADQETEKLLNEELESLATFFRQAKLGVPRFVDKALGWGSKGRFLLDKIPFVRGNRHPEFLRKIFGDCVFTPEQLEQTTEAMVKRFLDGISAIDNEMLVRMQKDVQDLPAQPLIAGLEKERLRQAFQEAIAQAQKGVGRDLKADVVREGLVIVSTDLLTKLTVRWGVSSGIIGAGAATSWTNLGVGLAIGVGIDQLVSWTWNRLADPRGKLIREVNVRIDQVHRLIVEGDQKNPGLRRRLADFAKERSELRKKAIQVLKQQKEAK